MPTFVEADRRRSELASWDVVASYRADQVRRVLAEFRAANNWQPGMVWDPFSGTYQWPGGAS